MSGYLNSGLDEQQWYYRDRLRIAQRILEDVFSDVDPEGCLLAHELKHFIERVDWNEI